MPKTYRKKPVEVQAGLVKLENISRVRAWCGGEEAIHNSEPAIAIATLEGTMFAHVGDYVIRGVQGEFYPCKPDIFAATYELSGASLCERDGHVRENKTNWCMCCNKEVGPRSADIGGDADRG